MIDAQNIWIKDTTRGTAWSVVARKGSCETEKNLDTGRYPRSLREISSYESYTIPTNMHNTLKHDIK